MNTHLVAPGWNSRDVYDYSDIAKFYGFSSLFVCYDAVNAKHLIGEVDPKKVATDTHIFVSGLGVTSSSGFAPSWSKGIMAAYGGVQRKDYSISPEQATSDALEHLSKKIQNPNVFVLMPTFKRDKDTHKKVSLCVSEVNAAGAIPVFQGVSAGLVPPHGQLIAASAASQSGRLAVMCDPSASGNDIKALSALGVTDIVFTFDGGFNHKSLEGYVADSKGA